MRLVRVKDWDRKTWKEFRFAFTSKNPNLYWVRRRGKRKITCLGIDKQERTNLEIHRNTKSKRKRRMLVGGKR